MRPRPALERAVRSSLRCDTDDARNLLADLDAAGYVVISKRRYREDTDREWGRTAERLSAEDEARSVRGWALGLADDVRHLSGRCSFLYGKAIEHGATPEELTGEG